MFDPALRIRVDCSPSGCFARQCLPSARPFRRGDRAGGRARRDCPPQARLYPAHGASNRERRRKLGQGCRPGRDRRTQGQVPARGTANRVIHHGLEPIVERHIREERMGFDDRAPGLQLPKGVVEIYDVAEGARRMSTDIREDHLWLLRHRSPWSRLPAGQIYSACGNLKTSSPSIAEMS